MKLKQTLDWLMGIWYEDNEVIEAGMESNGHENDPKYLCIHYKRDRCELGQRCFNGYSSSMICSDYVNLIHLEFFRRYHL